MSNAGQKEYLDGIQIPKAIYGELQERIARDLGLESFDALLDADGLEYLEADERMNRFIAKAIQDKLLLDVLWLRDKGLSGRHEWEHIVDERVR